MHTAFIQGQHAQVLDFDTSIFSAANQAAARILKYRSQLALHDYASVESSIGVSQATNDPSLAAIKAYALYAASNYTSELAVKSALHYASTASDNLTVQLLCSAILFRADHAEEALQLLGNHQGSLDAVAMAVQIHLSQNRTDLAKKEAASARSFAQDALLVNILESWIAVREGGDAKYQSAFYVFEELAQGPASSSASSLIAQAVSELHLGRYPEAETALMGALEVDGDNVVALANAAVLYTCTGDVAKALEMKTRLLAVKGGEQTEFAKGLAEKRDLFAAASEKYQAKIEV
jgi:coatomer protein complex subunit epsilon